MNAEFILGLAREAITVVLMMALPILGSGLAVGLAVSIFQATTQIQEPTLAFVPKIAAVLVAVMLFGGWVLNILVTFTLDLWGNLGTMF